MIFKLQKHGRTCTTAPMISLVILLLSCSGCALTTDIESISYYSQAGASVMPGASAVTVAHLDDRSGNHLQFSNKKNAFGATMAPILSDQPAGDIVAQALTEELRHRGFSVAAGGSTITIKMRQFVSNFDVGFFGADANAIVSFTIDVQNRDGAQVYSNTIIGKGLEPTNQIMSGGNARNAIEAALADAMRELMNDPTFFRALIRSAQAVT